MLRFAENSDQGRRRANNQDSLLVMKREGLFVVADGMGGHAAGDTASRIAVDTIQRYFQARRDHPGHEWGGPISVAQDPDAARLRMAIEKAHREILGAMEAEPRFAGMGTTVVAAWVLGSRAIIAHVGDSRCYLLRQGKLKQLTRDHSLVNALQDRFELNPTQKKRAQELSHVLTRALGVDRGGAAQVEMSENDIRENDILLLCSDGLTDEVQDDELRRILASEPVPGKAVSRLIRQANEMGGHDNITAIVVEVAANVNLEDTDMDEETVDMTGEWFFDDDEAIQNVKT